MTPATVAARRAAAPVRRADPVAPLRVVPVSVSRHPRRRLLRLCTAGSLVVSLLAVVAGHALLAEDQMRLSTAQAQLTAEQAIHRQAEVALAQKETPSRVASVARARYGMVPSQATQLAHVPLGTPLPPPSLTPAPHSTATNAATTATTTATTAGSPTGQ
jgi:hypothetical protein